jgi:hypothetical protein
MGGTSDIREHLRNIKIMRHAMPSVERSSEDIHVAVRALPSVHGYRILPTLRHKLLSNK